MNLRSLRAVTLEYTGTQQRLKGVDLRRQIKVVNDEVVQTLMDGNDVIFQT